MRYLLDTNTCIHIMRGVPSALSALAAVTPADVAISSVTNYELCTGVEKCVDPIRERLKVDALIGEVNLVAFDFAASIEAARIRANLESRGEMIGPYDVLIAGQSMSHGLILVTSNTNEFSRIPNLVLEDWQRPIP